MRPWLFSIGHGLHLELYEIGQEGIVAGDTIPSYDKLAVPEGQLPIANALHVDLREYVASLSKIMRLGGRILPVPPFEGIDFHSVDGDVEFKPGIKKRLTIIFVFGIRLGKIGRIKRFHLLHYSSKFNMRMEEVFI